jgi:tetratricopeptide (TPR) repeat protein
MDELDELVRSGIVFYNNNKYEHAIREFSKAITLDPGNAKIYNYMGMAYFYDNKHNEAIRNYEKALELEPDNSDFKRRLKEARKRKEEPKQTIIAGPVPPDIAIERFKQLESFLKVALNENKDIVLRDNVAGKGNPLNTYICFGTKRMDKKFPQGQPGTAYLRTGHKYYYWFHFWNANSNEMKGCFEFSLKDQDQNTRAIMNDCYRRYHGGEFPPNEQLRIRYFNLHINLRKLFSYEEVLYEANETVGEMLGWEDEYLKTLG